LFLRLDPILERFDLRRDFGVHLKEEEQVATQRLKWLVLFELKDALPYRKDKHLQTGQIRSRRWVATRESGCAPAVVSDPAIDHNVRVFAMAYARHPRAENAGKPWQFHRKPAAGGA
jgi:hypothetical protein